MISHNLSVNYYKLYYKSTPIAAVTSKTGKEKYDSPNPRRVHTFMSAEDVALGKRSTWNELEITGLQSFWTILQNKNKPNVRFMMGLDLSVK